MADYPNYVIEYAKDVQKKYGVPASVTISAWALESGRGTSSLATKHNNFFGITQFGTNGSVLINGRRWAAYRSPKESFESFGKLLSSPLYSNKTKGVKNVSEYVKAYSETYAPKIDGNVGYSDKILNIIKEDNLTRYDTKFKNNRPDLEVKTVEEMKEDRKDSWNFDGLLINVFVSILCLILIVISFLFIMKSLEIGGNKK